VLRKDSVTSTTTSKSGPESAHTGTESVHARFEAAEAPTPTTALPITAVSVAADRRVDTRIMYTAGRAAVELKMLGEKIKIIYAIPLSSSGKNPFFDRK